jgi:hypothetical protein
MLLAKLAGIRSARSETGPEHSTGFAFWMPFFIAVTAKRLPGALMK